MNLKGKRFENSRLDMEIFVYEIDGKEWFVGKDMCSLLEYGNSREAIKKHVWNEEKYTTYVKTIENIEKSQNMTPQIVNNNITFITEIGLYQLIFRSKMPKAREFQKWVFSEVLPSIRKNNFYIDKENITQEQINILKECLFDLCEDSKMPLGKASEKLFGNKKKLKEMFIECGYLDYEKCTYKQRKFKASNGKIYDLFVVNISSVVDSGLAKSQLQVSITNAGYIWLKNKIEKGEDLD